MNSPAVIAAPGRMAPSHTLRRLARVVRSLVALGALVLATVPLAFWSSPEWVRWHVRHNLGLGHAELTLRPDTLWLNAAVGLPAVAVGFFVLWQLWRLFGEYGHGRVFSREAVLRLRRFAAGVLVLGVLRPLTHTATVLVLTWHNAPGQRTLMLSLSSDDYLHVLLGAVLLAIAVVMAEAVRVAEENAEFV
jgi:hypothetical protein